MTQMVMDEKAGMGRTKKGRDGTTGMGIAHMGRTHVCMDMYEWHRRDGQNIYGHGYVWHSRGGQNTDGLETVWHSRDWQNIHGHGHWYVWQDRTLMGREVHGQV
jgi:hypothetical protein